MASIQLGIPEAEAVLQDDLVKARGGTNATVAGMDDMFDVMKQCDVVFTATGSEAPWLFSRRCRPFQA